jgi:hypothetical protein
VLSQKRCCGWYDLAYESTTLCATADG